MKNYRNLLPIVLIVLMLVSWFKLASSATESADEVTDYLKIARENAAQGITKTAIDNYVAALAIEPDVDVYVEVAEYYKSQGNKNDWQNWCEIFLEKYPTEPKAYDCSLEAYLSAEDYPQCFEILETASKRRLSSEYMTQTAEQIAYVFDYEYGSFQDVGVYSNNFCAIQKNDKWGFINRLGDIEINCKYTTVGAYTGSGLAPVVDKDGDVYLIDKDGNKMAVPPAESGYQELGLLVEEKIAAKRPDGKYEYVRYADAMWQEVFGNYDYASSFNGGVAAVRNGNQWSLIDAEGKELTQTKYEDVKLDEKQIAYRNERLFVKTGGSYVMVDMAGNQIGTQTFEDAKVFGDTTFAAVKIGGKWCFIDKDGNLKSDKTYEDARSYVNGMAAVQVDGKWGFVDADEELKIAAQFDGAKDFNEKGSCFVKNGDTWELLKLYRLNR